MYFKIKSNVLRVIEIGAVKLEINMGNFTRGRGRDLKIIPDILKISFRDKLPNNV